MHILNITFGVLFIMIYHDILVEIRHQHVLAYQQTHHSQSVTEPGAGIRSLSAVPPPIPSLHTHINQEQVLGCEANVDERLIGPLRIDVGGRVTLLRGT